MLMDAGKECQSSHWVMVPPTVLELQVCKTTHISYEKVNYNKAMICCCSTRTDNNAWICCIAVTSCKLLLLSKDSSVNIVYSLVDLLISWNMLVLSLSSNQKLVWNNTTRTATATVVCKSVCVHFCFKCHVKVVCSNSVVSSLVDPLLTYTCLCGLYFCQPTNTYNKNNS